jgi:hypothetical protein
MSEYTRTSSSDGIITCTRVRLPVTLVSKRHGPVYELRQPRDSNSSSIHPGSIIPKGEQGLPPPAGTLIPYGSEITCFDSETFILITDNNQSSGAQVQILTAERPFCSVTNNGSIKVSSDTIRLYSSIPGRDPSSQSGLRLIQGTGSLTYRPIYYNVNDTVNSIFWEKGNIGKGFSPDRTWDAKATYAVELSLNPQKSEQQGRNYTFNAKRPPVTLSRSAIGHEWSGRRVPPFFYHGTGIYDPALVTCIFHDGEVPP